MSPNGGRQKFKRTRYLISTRFQLRYVSLILLFMLLTAVICSYVVYYTGMMLLAEKLANVYPQGRVVSIVNAVNLRILFSMALITPLVVIVGIYISHKIAGPIYRMEKFLTDMSSGNLTTRIVLRQGDELVGMADKMNELSNNLRSTIGNQKTNLQKVLSELDNIKKVVDSRSGDIASIDKHIDRLHHAIKGLENELDKYKV